MNKIVFFITMCLALLMTIYHFISSVRMSRRASNPVYRALLFMVGLLGSLAIMVIAIVFNHAGAVATLKPEMVNRRFFLEIIFVAVLYSLICGFLFDRKTKRDALKHGKGEWDAYWNWRENADEDYDMSKQFLQGVAVAIISVIFLLTGTKFVSAGPVIFGKTLGNWVFSLYAGWTVATVFTFVATLIELPLFLVVGDRNEAFVNDTVDAIMGVPRQESKDATVESPHGDSEDAFESHLHWTINEKYRM